MLVYATGPVILAGSRIDGGSFSMVRLLLGIPVIGLLALAWHERPAPVEAVSRLSPVAWMVAGGACFGVHQLTLALAVKATSVAYVAVLNAIAPLIVASLAIPLLGEWPTRRFLWWSPVAILGSGAVVYLGSSGGGDVRSTSLALTNILFFSLFMLCSKQATRHLAVWPFLLGVMTTAAAVVAVIHVIWQEPVQVPSGHDLALAVAMAVGPGALGHYLMTSPLRWIPISLPPVIRLLQPFVSGMLAWAVLSQPFTWVQAGGAAVTAVGVLGAISTFPRSPQPQAAP